MCFNGVVSSPVEMELLEPPHLLSEVNRDMYGFLCSENVSASLSREAVTLLHKEFYADVPRFRGTGDLKWGEKFHRACRGGVTF